MTECCMGSSAITRAELSRVEFKCHPGGGGGLVCEEVSGENSR